MFLRHVGKHGDRKVAIIFREVPGEPHMCLVTYPEVLNQHIHDPLMKCIESDIGQNSEDLALALNRTYTKDGTIILQKLHAEGMLKKIRTELVLMTPAPNVRIKLNELNKILDEMKQGEAAVRKLTEMDASMGLQSPVDVARRMRGDKAGQTTVPVAPNTVATDGTLNDNSIANNLRQQAIKMSNEAKGLLAEADRLMKEADALNPGATSNPVVNAEPVKTRKARKSKVSV
jgi:hypothetical protein